jgi:hypothetical protein
MEIHGSRTISSRAHEDVEVSVGRVLRRCNRRHVLKPQIRDETLDALEHISPILGLGHHPTTFASPTVPSFEAESPPTELTPVLAAEVKRVASDCRRLAGFPQRSGDSSTAHERRIRTV